MALPYPYHCRGEGNIRPQMLEIQASHDKARDGRIAEHERDRLVRK